MHLEHSVGYIALCFKLNNVNNPCMLLLSVGKMREAAIGLDNQRLTIIYVSIF